MLMCSCGYLLHRYTVVRYGGFLSREKTRESRVSVVIRENLLDENLFASNYYNYSRYRASERGALGYRKLFSAKIYFQAIRESSLPRKKPAIPYAVTKILLIG